MNTKSIVVLVAFLAWSAICWAWYVLGIKGKYNNEALIVPKQDTLIQKATLLEDTLTADTTESVQILDQKTVLYLKPDSLGLEKDTLVKNYLIRLSHKLIIVKDTVVTIVGHDHILSKAEDNVAQSYKNAQVIQNFMLSKGAPASKIKIEGFGNKDTLVKDSTEEARYRNSRIEIFFNKKPQ